MSEVLDRQAGHDLKRADLRHETTTLGVPELSGEERLHHVVVVGGGTAGLELAPLSATAWDAARALPSHWSTAARTHLWKPLLHAVAAGSIDHGEYEVNFLAQAHWHGFRYRLGELVGLDRAAKGVHLAAAFDEWTGVMVRAQDVSRHPLGTPPAPAKDLDTALPHSMADRPRRMTGSWIRIAC
jgi:NADH:ubiquinone reductase (H+-translocating)